MKLQILRVFLWEGRLVSPPPADQYSANLIAAAAAATQLSLPTFAPIPAGEYGNITLITLLLLTSQ